MADLPSELRTLVDRYGAQVLDDADGLRATLNDFLDDDISPGDVNLLVDAVRFGALVRFGTLLDQGAETDAALTDVAEGLAQRRGGDVESAYWACAVLAYAADLLPADRIPGAQQEATPSTPLASRDISQTGDAGETVSSDETASSDDTRIVSRTGGAPLSDPVANRSSTEPTTRAPADDEFVAAGRADAPAAHDGGTGATKRNKVAAVASVLALAVAGVVAFALTRPNTDDSAAMHSAGHDVPIETVTVDDTFGHFGTPAVMNKKLESPCINAGFEDADSEEYRCAFKEQPQFYIDFDNGDPQTKGADGALPAFVTRPKPNTIVTVQQATPGTTSLHASVMKYQNAGDDGIRDTGDDKVELTLYDVDTDHPGSAEFKSKDPNTVPLTRDVANELLQSIGVDEGKFPRPEPFATSTNLSTDTSPLKQFAARFLTPKQLDRCVAGALAVVGEAEHVTCFASEDAGSSPYVVGFGLQRADPGLLAAQHRYQPNPPDASSWSWSDKDGARGTIVRSDTFSGVPRLFWYSDTADDATWGLISAPDPTVDYLLKTFEGFADQPEVVPAS